MFLCFRPKLWIPAIRCVKTYPRPASDCLGNTVHFRGLGDDGWPKRREMRLVTRHQRGSVIQYIHFMAPPYIIFVKIMLSIQPFLILSFWSHIYSPQRARHFLSPPYVTFLIPSFLVFILLPCFQFQVLASWPCSSPTSPKLNHSTAKSKYLPIRWRQRDLQHLIKWSVAIRYVRRDEDPNNPLEVGTSWKTL